MPLAIQFTKGSLAGRLFPVGAEPLAVGRSRSCGARPSEPDVSGRHVSLAVAGGVLGLEVLSAHRTAVDGEPAARGDVLALAPGSTVALGASLAFRVVDGGSAPDETATYPGTGTLSGETGTAATRFGGAGDETAAAATAATRFSPAEAPANEVPEGETSLYGGPEPRHAGPAPLAGGGASSADPGESGGGETQVLQTQVASAEELKQLRDLFRKKRTNRTAVRAAVFIAAFAAVVGISARLAGREPEKKIEAGNDWGQMKELLSDKSVWICGPTKPPSNVTTNEMEVRVSAKIGRDGAVDLWIAAETFEDPLALGETRAETFQRYLDKSSWLPKESEKIPLPDADFFGGSGGLHHGVPCSRCEYWHGDGEEARWGVVSFFRSGARCFAVRREVKDSERDRARDLLGPTSRFVNATPAFSDRQWEGSSRAMNSVEALKKKTGWQNALKAELEECQRLAKGKAPSEWAGLEARLRVFLVAASTADGEDFDVEAALDCLKDLREDKARLWKQDRAGRAALALLGDGSRERDAKEMDALVRKTFPDPGEEWGVLARRPAWWKK